MPTYNAENYVKEAIESVLNQTFDDFEYIIIDDGSTDDTIHIIRSFKDKRIKLIENNHDFIASLNLGIENASSKYLARMDADDIMHSERLGIQYSIMEEEPEITVCSSWMKAFGENIPPNTILKSSFGILDCPLLCLLKRNILFHSTIMIRREFICRYSLSYERYNYAEDYKLWVEIAKLGGVFYIESQPLLYYRISSEQVSIKNKEVQKKTSLQIQREILDYLLLINSKYQGLSYILKGMEMSELENVLTEEDIYNFYYNVFWKHKNDMFCFQK